MKIVAIVKEFFGRYSLADYGVGETPVPIPNTEVKPYIADGTWRFAAWKSRTSAS